jgi:hypothetical protein
LFLSILEAIVADSGNSSTEVGKITHEKLYAIVDMLYPETTIKPNLYNVIMEVGAETVMQRSNHLMIDKTVSSTDYAHMGIKVDAVAAHFGVLIKNEVRVHVS